MMKRILLLMLVVLLLAGCQIPATVPVVTTAEPVDGTTTAISRTEALRITEEEAKAIALEHAGLNTGAVKGFSIELDVGEGVYEVEFNTKGIEYDYEIDAYSGEILQAEKDRD